MEKEVFRTEKNEYQIFISTSKKIRVCTEETHHEFKMLIQYSRQETHKRAKFYSVGGFQGRDDVIPGGRGRRGGRRVGFDQSFRLYEQVVEVRVAGSHC